MSDQRYLPCPKGSNTLVARSSPESSSDEKPVSSHASGCGELLLMRRDFHLRLANSSGLQNESSALVQRMYAWRGYKKTQHTSTQRANEATLQTCDAEQVFGTLTVRYDSDAGLAADDLYGSELDAYRRAGARVAQLTRLAVDPELGSKEVLGALFHAAYVFCGPVGRVSDVFIEVNPRHVAFYQRMLNFRQAGEAKMCPRVDAFAVLLHVEVAYVGEQAARYGGRDARGERSLYPYFCSTDEAAQLTRRVLADRRADPGRGDRRARPRSMRRGRFRAP
jgi:hypothetical protein